MRALEIITAVMWFTTFMVKNNPQNDFKTLILDWMLNFELNSWEDSTEQVTEESMVTQQSAILLTELLSHTEVMSICYFMD